MTVREKAEQIKTTGNYNEAFDGKLDGRDHIVLQDKNSSKIVTVYVSKDDIDGQGRPETKSCPYNNLKDFFEDHPLDRNINPGVE